MCWLWTFMYTPLTPPTHLPMCHSTYDNHHRLIQCIVLHVHQFVRAERCAHLTTARGQVKSDGVLDNLHRMSRSNRKGNCMFTRYAWISSIYIYSSRTVCKCRNVCIKWSCPLGHTTKCMLFSLCSSPSAFALGHLLSNLVLCNMCTEDHMMGEGITLSSFWGPSTALMLNLCNSCTKEMYDYKAMTERLHDAHTMPHTYSTVQIQYITTYVYVASVCHTH